VYYWVPELAGAPSPSSLRSGRWRSWYYARRRYF